MLVLLQFPIADLRSFVDGEDTRVAAATRFASVAEALDHPDGPGPFIRDLGPLRRRRQGLRIAGESLYFRGRNGLRFAPGLHAVPDPRGGAPIPMRLLFRRFQAFSDGADGHPHRLAKYELGWTLDLARDGQPPLDSAQLQALIETCLALPATHPRYDAPPPAHRDSGPLRSAGEALARQLRWSTLAGPRRGGVAAAPWTVRACRPALLVEYGSEEFAGMPAGAARVSFKSAPDIGLSCQERLIGRRAVQCWYLQSALPRVEALGGGADVAALQPQPVRNLRVAVLRQHAEREVLAYALGCLARPGQLRLDEGSADADAVPTTPPRALLREYLLRSAALMRRRDEAGRQLPIAGAIDRMGPAAVAVNEADYDRFDTSYRQLTMVLGPRTMAGLQDAIRLLPMGEVEEDVEIARRVAASRPRPLRVAVSYTHRDERDDRLLSDFRDSTHVDALRGVVDRWDDLRIHPGDDWRQEILDSFGAADVIVLLLTPAFLASRFCMEQEVPLALARHDRREAVVLPVEVVECAWAATPLARVQALRPFGRPVTASGNRLAAWSVVRHALYVAASRRFAPGGPAPGP